MELMELVKGGATPVTLYKVVDFSTSLVAMTKTTYKPIKFMSLTLVRLFFLRFFSTKNCLLAFLFPFLGFFQENVYKSYIVVLFSVNRIWSEPLMNGGLPSPRSGHSCTTIGNDLIMFGGTNGTGPLNDLHILFTC